MLLKAPLSKLPYTQPWPIFSNGILHVGQRVTLYQLYLYGGASALASAVKAGSVIVSETVLEMPC